MESMQIHVNWYFLGSVNFSLLHCLVTSVVEGLVRFVLILEGVTMSLVKELLRSWLLYEVRGEEIFGEQLPWVFEPFGGREMVGLWLYRNILACAESLKHPCFLYHIFGIWRLWAYGRFSNIPFELFWFSGLFLLSKHTSYL